MRLRAWPAMPCSALRSCESLSPFTLTHLRRRLTGAFDCVSVATCVRQQRGRSSKEARSKRAESERRTARRCSAVRRHATRCGWRQARGLGMQRLSDRRLDRTHAHKGRGIACRKEMSRVWRGLIESGVARTMGRMEHSECAHCNVRASACPQRVRGLRWLGCVCDATVGVAASGKTSFFERWD